MCRHAKDHYPMVMEMITVTVQRVTDTNGHHDLSEHSFRNVTHFKEEMPRNWDDSEFGEPLTRCAEDKISQRISDTVKDKAI